ncbi:MAG: hypothetical protein LWW85_02390 [Marinilabiliales bacterium]|nr:hypothetical protein [Marinilabiliales bacterium]
MKYRHLRIIFPFFVLLALAMGCEDKYTEQYQSLEPVYMDYKSFRESVKTLSSQAMARPGKIYTIGHYILINELMKGIHVYDNAIPSAPVYKCFINIPGNVDMAVKDNILYADSYLDLVAIDLSQPDQAHEVGRLKEVFPYSVPAYDQSAYRIGSVDRTKGVVIGWELKMVKKEIDTNQPIYPIYYAEGFSSKMDALSSNAGSSGGTAGVGGSMARFGITGNSLLAVDNYCYYNINLSVPTAPRLESQCGLNGVVETMFLYGKNMFLGTTTGMLIYDLTDLNKPVYLTTFWHVTGCDPVVVQNDRAYVTIRGGNSCGSLINRLDVLDVTSLTKPTLFKSYNMDNPYGLGVSDDLLFVCDGTSGLKIYNVADPLTVDSHLIAKFPDIKAYDVIPMGKTLLMIGSDGLYQYDYSDLTQIKLISSIKVNRAS